MPARKTRGVKELPQEWKEKIRASALINRLVGCAMGEIEMDAQQIKAADILLKKIVPDLARIEGKQDIKHELIIRNAVKDLPNSVTDRD